ncbi:MAG TPA: ribonuclease HI [Anaerolineales bacterium]|nr:ribonuclease HI [Anaerolineales bacterium]
MKNPPFPTTPNQAGEQLPPVTLYTDGACTGNPGPGGYGIVLISGKHRKELSGGFRRTTNNRMELTACIEGLRALKMRCKVNLYSDSEYVVNGITKGWARRWRARGWMRNKKDRAENPDLWAQLLDICDQQDITFHWVRGHAGHAENERCDRLSVQAAAQPNLPPDPGYEKNNLSSELAGPGGKQTAGPGLAAGQPKRALLFDWGDTLMRVFPLFPGPMKDWPQVAAMPGAAEALAALQANWMLCIATNAADSNEEDIRAALRRVKLDEYIDTIYCYRSVGHRKPSPEFFDHILTDLNLDRTQVIMVGDDFDSDIQGANRSGLYAIWYTPRSQEVKQGEQYRSIGDLRQLPAIFKD